MFAKFLWIAVLAAFQVSESTPPEKAPCEIEKIKPVNLRLGCVRFIQSAEDLSPILLIHGLTGDMGSWYTMYQLLAYATRRMICAIDLRNHGESGRSNETDVAAMTADIHHLLKTHNVQKISLIGHSLGGKVAVHYALNFPEKVDRLVVEDMRANHIDPVALRNVQFFIKMQVDAIDSVPKGSTVEEAQAVVADYFNKKFEEMNFPHRIDENARRFLPIICPTEVCEWKTYRVLLDLVLQNPHKWLTHSHGTFNGPALFIYGENSAFKVYDDKDHILELFPNAEFYGIPGADHALHGIYREFDLQVIKFFNQ